jgi:hypothetical protein
MEIAGLGNVFSVCQISENPRGRVGAVLWVGCGPEMASGAGHLLLPPGLGKISSYVMSSAWTSLETMWNNRELVSKGCEMLYAGLLSWKTTWRNYFRLPKLQNKVITDD